MTSFFEMVRTALLRFSRFIGRLNTVLLLSISYYLILCPLALFRRLAAREKDPGGWLKRDALAKDHYRKQY